MYTYKYIYKYIYKNTNTYVYSPKPPAAKHTSVAHLYLSKIAAGQFCEICRFFFCLVCQVRRSLLPAHLWSLWQKRPAYLWSLWQKRPAGILKYARALVSFVALELQLSLSNTTMQAHLWKQTCIEKTFYACSHISCSSMYE